MLDGYEDRYSEDDGEGSRAVPSRTSLGCEAAFVKDFPSYGSPRWRLGRWERNFGYRCILTCAQIELMQGDLPHTLYSPRDKDGKPKPNKNDKAMALQEEANKKARERRAANNNGK